MNPVSMTEAGQVVFKITHTRDELIATRLDVDEAL